MEKENKKQKMHFEETRAFETREVQMNYDEIVRNLKMDYQGSLYIDKNWIPQDQAWSWVRESIFKSGEFGGIDHSRMSYAYRKGWQPVKAEDVPQLASNNPFSYEDNREGYIRRDGQILCWRPAYVDRVEREKRDRDTHHSMTYVKAFGADISPRYISPLKIEAEEQGRKYGAH